MNIKEQPIHIATATTRLSKSWQTREITWGDLITRCRIPKRTSESVAQYFAMPKEEQGKAKDVGGFVGGTLKGGRRTKEAITSRDLVTLDLDHAPQGFWEHFQRLYRGTAAFLYSTHSHTPENPRLRLIILLSRTIEADAYEPIARSVAHDLGMDFFDDTTYEASRMMYFPSCPADGEYIFEEQLGSGLDPESVLSGYDDWRNAEEWPISSRESKRTITGIRKMEDPLLKEGIIGDFCREFSIHDAIETFLPEIYAPGTMKNRYTYLPGTTSNGLVVYEDKYAHAFQSTDPLCGEHSYNAFDLVRVHLFGKSDARSGADKLPTELPSYKKMISFLAQNDRFRKAQTRARLEEARDDFSSEMAEGEEEENIKLELDKNGNVAKTQKNFIKLLSSLPEFKDRLWYDSFDNRVKVSGLLPWNDRRDSTDRPLSSEDYSMINTYFVNRYNFGLTRTNLLDSVITVAKRRERHPIREYLETLTWDGTPRLDTLFIDFLAASDSPLIRAMTRKHLVGAVKRVFNPGCSYDQVIIFTGAQGAGKSTIIRLLGGKWFKPLSSSFAGKESMEQLAGGWIFESGELKGWRGAEIETIKDFFTRTVDHFRPAYGMTTNDYPRQCIFFATTNDSVFLSDPTGNRRFWPISVRKGEAKFSIWDDFTPYYRDQIWAEAYTYYRNGEETYLSPEQEQDLMKLQRKYTDTFFYDLSATIEEYLETRLPQDWYTYTKRRRINYFRFDSGEDMIANMRRDKVCLDEILSECLTDGRFRGRSVRISELAAIFEELPDWRQAPGSIRFGTGYGSHRGYVRITQDPLDDL